MHSNQDEGMKTIFCYDLIVQQMLETFTSLPQCNSISKLFLSQMLPHCESALHMASNILLYSTNICIQDIATNTIAKESKNRKDIQELLSICSQHINTPAEIAAYAKTVQQILNKTMQKTQNAYTSNNINTNFIRQMILHHETAIRLAQTVLCYSICPILPPMLHKQMREQTKQIQTMQQLLYCL